MNFQVDKKWLIGGGIGALVLVVLAIIAWQVKSIDIPVVSEGKSAAETPASEAEINEVADELEETEEEVAEEATDPSIPRSLNEMVVAHPHNEEATTEQIKQQIISNEESNDPTHQQEASCSWLSEYGNYVHYECMGYTLGGTSDAIGRIEVTVNTNTGEVLVEEE